MQAAWTKASFDVKILLSAPRVVRLQMAMFVSESQQSYDADPLQRKKNKLRFKSLSSAARQYLAIPARENICNRKKSGNPLVCSGTTSLTMTLPVVTDRDYPEVGGIFQLKMNLIWAVRVPGLNVEWGSLL
jgi:hypothetical protein